MRGPVGHSIDDATLAECERLMEMLREVVIDDDDEEDLLG
jgi:hypothetical protein